MTTTPELLAELRKNYVNKRVRFIEHKHPDPNPITPGMEGLVLNVDDAGTIHVRWDNGRFLGLVPEADIYELIDEKC